MPQIKIDIVSDSAPSHTVGQPISVDTFEIIPFPHDSLKAPIEDREDSLVYDGLEVLEEERFYDFRRSLWLEDMKQNPLGSPVCLKRNVRIYKNSDCKKIVFRFSSSGAISARCNNFKYKYNYKKHKS